MTRLLALLGRDAMSVFGWRVPALVSLMVLSGVLEGLAVAAMLPLLSEVGGGGAQSAQVGGIIVTTLVALTVALGLPEGPVGVGMLMVGLVTGSAMAYLAMARLAALLQAQYALSWQISVFSSALAAGPSFVDARRGGDLVAAIVTEVNRLGGAFYHGCLVLAALVNLMIYLGLAWAISPPTSVAVIALGAGLILATRPFMRRAFGYGKAITRSQGDIQSFASEAIAATKALKANVAEELANERFADAAGRYAEATFKNSFDVQKARAVFDFGGTAGLAVLLVAGPLFLNVEIASILVVVALFVRLLPRIAALQQGIQALNVLLPALENLQSLRDEARAAAEPDDQRSLPLKIAEAPASIAFRGVSVSRGETRALDGVDLEFPAGKIVALVGPSGSGKSTLVDAILGLVPISSGRIEIGGVPLHDLPLKAWRRAIGYVAQDTALLAGSISDNVRLGTQADTGAVDAALEQAAAHFVRHLVMGVDTQVGDRGSRLSGGERQRLGLARALAAPRCLFILDEATSALDAETEAEVLRSVAQLSGNATVLVVAHRFSAVRDADVIYVLEHGRIIESGDWPSLDRPGSRFFALKQLQEMSQRQPEIG
ncbi:MAG: ABC transporter ATP-binding protein [Roseicyclus sp.]|uniref:ABC transporter ATP-binding protein n=1 Tax=Roseicyclus sp. TaxID=1914329 RepID=UPI003A86A679